MGDVRVDVVGARTTATGGTALLCTYCARKDQVYTGLPHSMAWGGGVLGNAHAVRLFLSRAWHMRREHVSCARFHVHQYLPRASAHFVEVKSTVNMLFNGDLLL